MEMYRLIINRNFRTHAVYLKCSLILFPMINLLSSLSSYSGDISDKFSCTWISLYTILYGLPTPVVRQKNPCHDTSFKFYLQQEATWLHIKCYFERFGVNVSTDVKGNICTCFYPQAIWVDRVVNNAGNGRVLYGWECCIGACWKSQINCNHIHSTKSKQISITE